MLTGARGTGRQDDSVLPRSSLKAFLPLVDFLTLMQASICFGSGVLRPLDPRVVELSDEEPARLLLVERPSDGRLKACL